MAKSGAEREAALADELLSISELASDVQRAALLQARDEAAAGKLRDPAATARNASVTAGISIEKRALLLDKPSVIVEHRDGAEILRSIGQRVPGLVVESTAEEIPPLTLPTRFDRPDPDRAD